MNSDIEKSVAELETLIGGPLPADYRAFLTAYRCDELLDQSYWMPHPSGRWVETIADCHTLDFLLEDIMPAEVDLWAQGHGSFEPGKLPIANNGAGDTVLLSCRGEDYGAVYHYFHEEGDDREDGDRTAGHYLIATSFTDWLSQMADYARENAASSSEE